MRTTHLITTWQLHFPSHSYYLIGLWKSSVVNCYFGKFSLKRSDVFFQDQTLFMPYHRNGWPDWCKTKRKCIGWILGILCDLDLWPHSWPWTWMFQCQISKWLHIRNCWCDWFEMKKRELIGYWADHRTMTTPLTLTLEFQGQSPK